MIILRKDDETTMSEEKDLKKLYDEHAESYFESRAKNEGFTSGWQNREIERPYMYKIVPATLSGKKLLDVGCGAGIHLKEYISRGANGFGMDLSSELIKIAQQHCPDGSFKVGSVYELPYDDDSFDVVTSSLVFDHVKEFGKGIDEIKRVLKSGGLFIVSLPHPIINMFRKPTKGSFIPDTSYFDKKLRQYNIAGSGQKFPGFPLIMEDYVQLLLKRGFILEEFVENRPDPSWKEKYKDFDENFLKIPLFCFFRWRLS